MLKKHNLFFLLLLANVISLAQSTSVTKYDNARILYHNENFQEAIFSYNSIIAKFPKDYIAYHEKGLSFLALSKYNDAIISFSNSIKYNPKFIPAILDRAIAKNLIKNFEDALNDVNKAIELDNTDISAYAIRANILANQEKYQDAILDLSYCIKSCSDNFSCDNYKMAKYYYSRAIYYQLKDTLSDNLDGMLLSLADRERSCELGKEEACESINNIKERIDFLKTRKIREREYSKNESSTKSLEGEPSQEMDVSIEQMPEFPGGQEALFRFLGKNIVYPENLKKKKISGTVYLKIAIGKNGEVSNIEVIKGVPNGKELDDEAIRVSKLLHFTPGKDTEGNPVKVWYNLPIKFSLR